MNIAIFSDNFHPEIGGIQDSIELLAQELAGRGHRIRFYAPRYSLKDYQVGHLPFEEIKLAPNVSITRFASLSFPSPTLQSRVMIPSPFRWLAVKKFSPDVIHTQTFFGVGWEALIASRMLRIPVIGTNHMAVRAFQKHIPIGIEWFLKYVVWYYNRCDYVTAPSKSVFGELTASGLIRERQVVSNPIDMHTFDIAPTAAKKVLKQKFGVSNHTVAFAGRLDPVKNIDDIVKAIPIIKSKFPDVTFAIAGHGSAEKELRALARELGVESNVKFLGMLDESDLANLYQASEIFAIMSRSETQSMSLLQAMACGLPAVGAASNALPEYLGGGTGFLVPPGDYIALAKKIVKLFGDSRLRVRLGRNGRKYTEQFSSGAVALQWEKIYENVITRYNRGKWI